MREGFPGAIALTGGLMDVALQNVSLRENWPTNVVEGLLWVMGTLALSPKTYMKTLTTL